MYKRKRKSTTSIKTRSLRPYLGISPYSVDAKYNSTSSQGTMLSNWYIEGTKEEGALKLFQSAYAARSTMVSYSSNLGSEEIVSVGGSERGMKNCTHTRFQVVNRPVLTITERYNNSGTLYLTPYYREPYNLFASTLGQSALSLSLAHPVGGDPGFSARAFWSMRPKFVGEVSLINSLFELKDFKDVFSIGKIVGRFRSMASAKNMSSFKRESLKLAHDNNVRLRLHETFGVRTIGDLPMKNFGEKLVRDVSGAAAAAVLMLNLAIKPTVADLLSIAAQMQVAASDAQSYFGLYGGLGSSSHFSEIEIDNQFTYGTLNMFYKGTGLQTVVKKTASMRSYYDYKMRSLNETLVRYWGLSGTTEALWNTLPLSFVLDYVLTVGKSLSYMERDDNVTNLRTAYCESVKISISSGLHYVLSPRVHSVIFDGVHYGRSTNTRKLSLLVSGTEATRYTRKVMEPYKGPALPKFKLPSTSQAVNMLALLRCLF